MKNKILNVLSELAVPVTILAGSAIIIWYMYESYTQCIADGYSPTACRMILTGKTMFIQGAGP